MGRKLVQETNLQNIAAAIRSKSGSNSTYKPREMADAIRSLPSSSTLVPKAITENGSYSPQSENADGYSSVTVNVGRYLGNKSITRNGTFRAASDHVDGYSSVSVNVPNSYSALDEGKVVSSGALTPQTSLSVTQNGTFDTTRNNQVTVNVSGASNMLVSKTITANGTYLPANDNADGFSSVSVAVPGGFDVADDGKVVLNGALMPQTSLNVSANGTYDTTANSSVVVNVSGGGGDYWRVQYYDGSGTILMHTEYVANGGNGTYHTDYDWATTAGGAAVSGVTENVQSSLTLYCVGMHLIEYIESTGTQYVNTDVHFGPATRLLVEFNIAANQNGRQFPMIWNTAGSPYYYFCPAHQGGGGKATTAMGYGEVPLGVLMPSACDLLLDQNANGSLSWSGDGVTTQTFNINACSRLSDYPMGIFAPYNGASISTCALAAKLYRFRVYEGTSLVRDFRPVLNGNVACLYDLVTETYFYNAGTGTFGTP